MSDIHREYSSIENLQLLGENYINQGLLPEVAYFVVAGKQRLMPFFNRSNNEDLILAIQSAGAAVAEMDSEKIKEVRNWLKARRIYWSIVQMGQMRLIPYI